MMRLIPYSFWIILLFHVVSSGIVQAQIIPIDDLKEEQIRIQQLLNGSLHSSFTNRPVWNGIYEAYYESGAEQIDYGLWSRRLIPHQYQLDDNLGIHFGIYSPSLGLTTNSNVPYGWNNEAAWYGRGVNSSWTGGFWITSDFITITVRPQFTTQQNHSFEVPRFIEYDSDGNIRYHAEAIGDNIDNPFRFGPDPFTTFSHGYTSIRAHYKQIETGFSTEPLWWGGSVNYPLLMSNNAPGMQHFFIGTRYPVKIPYIGKIEFKWIGAFPERSQYFDQVLPKDENDNVHSYLTVHNDLKLTNDRFMNGINFSFSPSFAPNIHIGWSRAVHTYINQTGLKFSDLTMVFDPILLENFIDKRGPLNVIKPRNHLTSVYGRWIWPESRFELYGEFFRDDFSWDSRDFLMEPRQNSGYSFGFQKLVLAPYAHFYRLNVELTNMTPSFIQEVRRQDYFYSHPEIREGHTNKGQLLGAAIGPGSNSQFLSLDSYQDWGRVGFYVRRYAVNNHFHFNYDRSLNRPEEFRQGFGDYWRNRTDLTVGVRTLYNHQHIYFSGEFSWTKLFNYGRFDYGRFGGLNIANFEPYDITNLQISLSVEYRF